MLSDYDENFPSMWLDKHPTLWLIDAFFPVNYQHHRQEQLSRAINEKSIIRIGFLSAKFYINLLKMIFVLIICAITFLQF